MIGFSDRRLIDDRPCVAPELGRQSVKVRGRLRIGGWKRWLAQPEKGGVLGFDVDILAETPTHPLGQDLGSLADNLQSLASPDLHQTRWRHRLKQTVEFLTLRVRLIGPIGQKLRAKVPVDDRAFQQLLDQTDRTVQQVRGHGRRIIGIAFRHVGQ